MARANPDPIRIRVRNININIVVQEYLLQTLIGSLLCRHHRRCTATAAADGGSTAAPLQDRPPQKRPGRKRREIWAADSSVGGPCPRPGRHHLRKRPPTPSTHHCSNNDDKFAGGELRVTWLHADGALAAGDGGPQGRPLRGTPSHRGGQENSQGTSTLRRRSVIFYFSFIIQMWCLNQCDPAFFVNADPETDPDPDPGFDDLKLGKI